MTFFFASRFTIMKLMIIYRDIDAIHECINTCHLTLIPSISNFINLWGGNLISHLLPLLGCNIKISWADHIEHIYIAKFCAWADKSTILRTYVTCIRPHLEYTCQLWDPHTTKGVQSVESVQKFACKVCLKQWDINYKNYIRTVGPYTLILSKRQKLLKLTTMLMVHCKNQIVVLANYLAITVAWLSFPC